jgi:hypothetical protein
MARSRILLPLALALLALGVGAQTAPAMTPPERGPLFVPDPHGPYDVGKAPTTVLSGNFDPMGRGFEKNLLIGYARGSRANLFYADRHRPGLRKLGYFSAPTGPSAFGGTSYDLAILSPGSDQARFYDIDQFSGALHSKSTVETGPEPVAAVVDDFVSTESGEGFNTLDLAVADRLTGQLQLFSSEGGKHLHLAGSVPLGPEPTAAIGHECCVPVIYVTTAGNDRLNFLSGFKNGEFRERLSFPVGDRPSAVALGDFVRGDYRDEELAVANRGSDNITILDAVGRTYEFRTIGTYPVGHEPVAISAIDIDHRDGLDLAVVNTGSDDVSILLNDGSGGFKPGGTFPVGKEPVALAEFRFNRPFEPDLAIVNRGSGDLTILLRRVDGKCRGREAQRVLGTDGPDLLTGLGRGPNQTEGLGGDDTINGAYGGDCLSGGAGDDLIRGGSQGDLIAGGPGDDELLGEGVSGGVLQAGNDTVVGGPGEDRIDAGPGADRVLARDGERDRIDCGHGHDTAWVDAVDRARNCERVHVAR